MSDRDIDEVLAAEREAICDMLASAEANTPFERLLSQMDDYMDEVSPGLADLMSRICTAAADELREWQRLIRARAEGPIPETGHSHVIQPNTPLTDSRFRCGMRIVGAPLGDTLTSEDNLSAITCPGCLQAMLRELRDADVPKGDEAAAWLAGDDTGISSKTIWHVMTGKPMPGLFPPDTPKDPADFGRCFRLFEQFPQWYARFGEVADRYPEWRPLVDTWAELAEMYERAVAAKGAEQTRLSKAMYARMKKLLRCPECDGLGSEFIGDGTHGGTEQQACSACGGCGERR